MAIELEELAIVGLNIVLFPNTVAQFYLSNDVDCQAIDQCLGGDGMVGISLLHDGAEIAGGGAELYLVGTRAKILNIERIASGGMNVRVRGVERFRIRRIDFRGAQVIGQVEPLEEESTENESRVDALAMRAEELFSEFLESSYFDTEFSFRVVYPTNSVAISFIIANFFPLEIVQKQHLLELTDTALRLQELIGHLLERNRGRGVPQIYQIGTAELREWINRN